VLLE
jgi:hypothetical protein